jgi:hypothetical protein
MTDFNFSHYFVLDVESIGLHGEGYAAAYAVFDTNGTELAAETFSCNPQNAKGDASDRNWVTKNVPPVFINCSSPGEVRNKILQAWLIWRPKGAALCADCTWPVESNFLSAAIADRTAVEGESAKWLGPYPVLDISTFRILLLQCRQPLPERDLVQYPEHQPLADVRYSAKVLFDALLGLRFAN